MVGYTMRTASRLLLLIFALSIIDAARAKAEDSKYLWPLPASRELTSGFCQWRSGHFHTGIDIRTFGKTGYKVVAVENCTVYRIVTRWNGYGKALYLRLSDGRLAVYAHLEKFTHEINKYVQENQLGSKRYRTDLYPPPDMFRFSKGDVVAYTGQTGAGAPHLHFEIRDKNNLPLSPLRYLDNSGDTRPPVIRHLYFTPLNRLDARVNGSSTRTEIPLVFSGNGYTCADTVVVYGPVGVELDCVDRRPGTGRSYAVSSVEMFMDDYEHPIFATLYDSVSFDRWGDVNLETNYSAARNGQKFVRNLYVLPGADPPVVNRHHRHLGIIHTEVASRPDAYKPGHHTLMFRIRDEAENTSRASVTIDLRVKPYFFQLARDEKSDTGIVFSNWSYEYAYIDTVTGEIVASDDPVTPKERRGSVVLASAYDDFPDAKRSRFDYLFLSERSGMPSVLSWMPIGAEMVDGSIERASDLPILKLRNFAGSIQPASPTESSITLELDVIFNESDSTLQIDPEDVANLAGSINFDIGSAFVVRSEIPLAVAYNPLATLTFENKDLFDHLSAFVDTSTQSIGKWGNGLVYSLSPTDYLFRNFVEIKIPVEHDKMDSKWGLFKVNGGSASYVATEIDSSGYLRANISSFGDYTLLQDRKGPSILQIYPAKGAVVRKSRPKISFLLKDELSGIRDDRDVEITVDGVWAIPEYDIDTKWMSSYPSQTLKPGTHTLKIRALDKMGNESVFETTFVYSR